MGVCVARMKLRGQVRDSQRVVDTHFSSRVRVSCHINYSPLLRLFQHRQQQVRQQKVTQIIHLQMRLVAVRCLLVGMEGYPRVVNENIHFGVVALCERNWDLLRWIIERLRWGKSNRVAETKIPARENPSGATTSLRFAFPFPWLKIFLNSNPPLIYGVVSIAKPHRWDLSRWNKSRRIVVAKSPPEHILSPRKKSGGLIILLDKRSLEPEWEPNNESEQWKTCVEALMLTNRLHQLPDAIERPQIKRSNVDSNFFQGFHDFLLHSFAVFGVFAAHDDNSATFR